MRDVKFFITHYSPALLLLLLAGLNCGCQSASGWLRRQPPAQNYPIAFPATATREEIVAALNANTVRVRTLQAPGSVSIPGAPSLSSELALERPRNLRFRAGTVLGPEIDLGGNADLFWFWAHRAPSPALFYAQHEKFAVSKARQALAVDPAWIVDSLGLIEVDPASVVEGPAPIGTDKLEIRIRHQTPGGETLRLVRVHRQFGYMMEQHLYDSGGQLIAATRASEHQHYHIDGVTLPHKIEISVPQAQMTLTIALGQHTLNQPISGAAALFTLPQAQYKNYPLVDVADPNFAPPAGPGAIPAQAPPQISAQPRAPSSPPGQDFRPRYRGGVSLR